VYFKFDKSVFTIYNLDIRYTLEGVEE